MDKKENTKHPTKDIIGSLSTRLHGKKICLCITSSVAIVNSSALARELMRHGAEVYTVMTPKSTELISPKLLEWATGNPVITEISGKIEHIHIAGERENLEGFADLIIIYPSTANTLGKIANGIADNAVTAISMVALGSKVPLFIVPAMHDSMFRNPFVQSNIESLRNEGVKILGPRLEENKAKIADIQDVIKILLDHFQHNPLPQNNQEFQGKNILITAGASKEWIDDVRYITNNASGKTGFYLAQKLISRGAKVTFFIGANVSLIPIDAKIVRFETTENCATLLKKELKQTHYDILISTAAFADFTPLNSELGKISSKKEKLLLELRSTPKIIKIARNLKKNLFIVGFKAEAKISENELLERAYQRLQENKLNLMVANLVDPDKPDRGFKTDKNEVFIIDPSKNVVKIELKSKEIIASKIIEYISSNIKE